jgi:hypothetical protein
MESLKILIDLILQLHNGPAVDSTSNRNEYQVYLLGVKGIVHWADKLANFMCRLSTV